MHIIEPTYTHTMHNVMLDQKSDKYLQIFAVSFVFALSKPKTLLPMCQTTGKIESLLQASHSGVDEGQPKRHAEFMVLGSNTPNDNQSIPQKISVDVQGTKKSLYVYPKRHWVLSKAGQYQLVSESDISAVPLNYDNAYGGEGFLKNPLGKGYLSLEEFQDKKLELPQVEASPNSITSPYEKNINPISFGPLRVDFSDRQKYLGQYGSSELKALPLRPRLPKNTQDEFYQSAPKDQWLSSIDNSMNYKIEGMTAKPLSGKTPAYKPTLMTMSDKGKAVEHEGITDTFLLFPNQDVGILTTRFIVPTEDFTASEYTSYMVQLDDSNPVLKRTKAENITALQNRLGENRHLYALKEDDLLPKSISSSSLGGESMPSAESQELANNMASKASSLNQEMSSANEVFSRSSSSSSLGAGSAVAAGTAAFGIAAGAALGSAASSDTTGSSSSMAVPNISSVSSVTNSSSLTSEIPNLPSENASNTSTSALDLPNMPSLSSSTDASSSSLSSEIPSMPSVPSASGASSSSSAVNIPSASTLSSATASSTTGSSASSTVLSHNNISGSNLLNQNYVSSNIENSDWSKVKIAGGSHNGTSFTNVNFTQSRIKTIPFENCRFENCQFTHALMQDININNCQFSKCNFDDAIFYRTQVHNSSFKDCQFENTQVTKTDFVSDTWSGGSFKRFTAEKTNFQSNTFNQVHIDESGFKNDSIHFTHCKFSGCVVSTSSFSYSVWDDVNISGGTWSANNFSNAQFDHVSFSRVNAPDNSWVNLHLTNSQLSETEFGLSNWTALASRNSTMYLCNIDSVIVAYATLPTQTVKA